MIYQRYVKFGTGVDHKHSPTLYIKYFYKSVLMDMVTVRNIEVISDKFYIDRICTSSFKTDDDGGCDGGDDAECNNL